MDWELHEKIEIYKGKEVFTQEELDKMSDEEINIAVAIKDNQMVFSFDPLVVDEFVDGIPVGGPEGRVAYEPTKNSFQANDIIKKNNLVGFIPFPHPKTIERLICEQFLQKRLKKEN